MPYAANTVLHLGEEQPQTTAVIPGQRHPSPLSLLHFVFHTINLLQFNWLFQSAHWVGNLCGKKKWLWAHSPASHWKKDKIRHIFYFSKLNGLFWQVSLFYLFSHVQNAGSTGGLLCGMCSKAVYLLFHHHCPVLHCSLSSTAVS